LGDRLPYQPKYIIQGGSKMKLKKSIGITLAFILAMTNISLGFAEEKIYDYSLSSNDDVVSGSAIISEQVNDDISLVSVENGANGFIAEISTPDPNATVITTAEELANIQSGGNYVLGNDIDLSTYNGGVWIPINPTGEITLDGQGYEIINIYIPESNNTEYAGLFGKVNYNITIENIGIESTQDGIVSSKYSGGLIGYASSATIKNSYNNASVTGSYYSGGLVGYFGSVNISYSYNNGNISTTADSISSYSGGLVGGGDSAVIEKSHNNGYINGFGSSGGLIGCASAIIKSSYNNGTIDSSEDSGGLIGFNNTSDTTIKNSYNCGDIISSKRSGGLIGAYNVSHRIIITVENCYNIGRIYNNNFNGYKGNIIGYLYSKGTLQINGANYYIGNDDICGNKGAKITYEDGAFCKKVKNIEDMDFSKLEFSNDNYEFELGKDYLYHLRVDMNYPTSDKSEIIFTSSNPDVADISEFYMETDVLTKNTSILCNLDLKALGTTTITVTNSKGVSSSCVVVVSPIYIPMQLAIESVDVNGEGATICLDKISSPLISVKFNADVNINDNVDGGAYLYHYVNGTKYYIGNRCDIGKIEIDDITGESLNNTIGIPMKPTKIPKGEIYIEFDKDIIMPVSNDIKVDMKNINNSFFENTANFVLGIDSLNFVNDNSSFNDKHYSISKETKNKLKSIISSRDGRRTLNHDLYFSDWSGACYGMSSYTAMANRGTLDFMQFSKNGYNEGEEYLKNYVAGSKLPKDDTGKGGLRDNLHYLQLLQLSGLFYVNYFEFSSEKDKSEELKKIILAMSESTKETPILLNIAFHSEGKTNTHTILPYKLEKSKTGYTIYCYDPNYPETATKVLFDNNYENLKVEDLTNTYSILEGIGFDYVEDVENLYGDGISSLSLIDQEKNNNVFLSILLDNNIEISNDEIVIYYSNGKFSGATDSIIGYKLYGGGTIGSAAEIRLELPKGNYNVKSTSEGSLNCSFDNGEMFADVKTSNKAEVSFNESKNVNVSGDNITSNILLSFDGDGSDSILVDVPKTDNTNINATDINCVNIKTDTSEKIDVTKITDCEETDKKEVSGNSTINFDDETIIVDDNEHTDITEPTTAYTIKFNSSGGSSVENMTVKCGNTVDLPTPIKEGYSFKGWFTDLSLKDEFKSTNKVESNLTLYAKWEKITEPTVTYIVKFNSNGGSNVEDITADNGNTINLPTPTREGYAFKGWFKESSLESEFKSTDKVESNLTLYAKWNKIITLTFDSKGGSSVDSINVETGTATALPVPTKEGCTFGGWYLDSLWSNEYTDTTEAPSYNRTLYAKWIKILPTETEIKAKYNSLNLSPVANKFEQIPSVTSPYSAGKLSDSFISTGIDYINFIRYICGLQEVSIDASKADLAQHGAVLMAASEFSHYPSQPSDMDSNFYNLGLNATSSSNIAWSSSAYNNLYQYVQMWLDDEDSSNIDRVGHRRWLINPYMKYTAFGYATKGGAGFSNVLSFDESNKNIDYYDFLAYPTKGNFPNNIIDNTIPWSVSLNTALYKVDSVNDINVKVTKKSSGKSWSISQADYKAKPSSGDKYFNYNDVGYGIDSCIIFSIGKDNISNSDLNGEFDIEITGLKDSKGNDASINYTVNFFDISKSTSSSDDTTNNSTTESTTESTTSSSSSSSSGSGHSSGGGGGGGSSSSYYTVKFDSNNGSTVTSKKVVRNKTLTEPSEPIRDGYTFTGWYTDKECTKKYDFNKKITSAFTLYAGWKKLSEKEAVTSIEEKTDETVATNDYDVVKVTIGNKNVAIGEKSYKIDVAPYIQLSSNSTLVPLRFVALAICGEDIDKVDSSKNIVWDANTKTATIYANGKTIQFTANSDTMIIDGQPSIMEYGVKAEIKDGRLFIPFRALGKALDVDVDWEADTKTAIYKKK